jgi:hypothetical protein
MTQPNLLDLAKQGDPRAITGLLNRSLQPKGITAKVSDRSGSLHVLLEAASAPNQASAIRFIEQGLSKLGLPSQTVTVYARQEGNPDVAWQESFELANLELANLDRALANDDLSFDSPSVDAPSEAEDALSFSDDEPAPNFGFDLNAPIDDASVDYSATDYSATDYSAIDYAPTDYASVESSDFGFEPDSPFAVGAAYGALDDVEEDGPTSSPFAAYDPTYEGISIEEPASSPFAAPSIYDTLNTAPDTIAFASPDQPELGFSMPDINAATPNLQMQTSGSSEPTIVEPPSAPLGMGVMGAAAGVMAGTAAMAGKAASTASKTVAGAAAGASQFTFGDLDLDRPRTGAAAPPPPPPPKTMPHADFIDSSHGEATLIVDNSDEEMGVDDEDPDSDILMSLWGEMDDDSIEDDLIDASAEAERSPGIGSGLGERASALMDDRPVTVVGEPRLSKGGNLNWLIVFPIAALLGLGSAAFFGKLGPVLAGVPVLGQFFGGSESGLVEASNTIKSTSNPPIEPSGNPKTPTPSPSTGDKGSENPVEKPADKPVEKPADKPIEKPVEKPADQPAAKPVPGAVAFYNGVKLATQAAALAQTAKGPQEWTTVAGKWQEAAQLMEEVPETFDRATIAQQKVVEYQKNATIAQSRAK